MKTRAKTTKPSTNDTQPLCPAQQRAFDQLAAGLETGALFCLRGGVGQGKTTLLKTLRRWQND